MGKLILKNGERSRKLGARRRRQVGPNTSSEPWTAAEELRLREFAGTVQVRDIARALSKGGVPRTVNAVNVRARMLGVSLWWEGYSQNQVVEAFGVTSHTVTLWAQAGLLKHTVWEGGGRSRFGQWHITEADLYHFVDTYPWAYDLKTMAPGVLRRRAEVATRADPWLTVDEVAAAIGMGPRQVKEYVRQGLIPHRRRVAGMGQPKIVVRAVDLPGLRQEIRADAIERIRAAVVRRVQRRQEMAA